MSGHRSTRVTRRAAWPLLVLAAGLLLSGCTGIPTWSAPDVVGTLGVNAPQASPLPTPIPGELPRTIVLGFLQANAANDEHHAAARQYLTPEEKTRWSDTAGTTIFDTVRVASQFDSVHKTIRVTGHVVGTLDQNGVYKPNTQGDGTSTHGPLQNVTVSLRKVHDQWRISNLSNSGLLLSQSQFAQSYRSWSIYFYDQAEQRLVPNPRYSPLTDPQALGGWLLDQLAAGPATSPTTASLSTDLPSIPSTAQLKLTMGRQTVIELPGANQLDSPTKNRMAAQIALTLNQAAPNTPIEITDGGKPVVIPAVGSAPFTATDFGAQIPSGLPNPALYFIYHGGVSDQRGDRLAGGIGSGAYHLSSVALAPMTGSQRLRVAATSGTGDQQKLLLGQTGGTLTSTSVSGPLSRPDWVPGLNEVWIGDGTTLYRVGRGGKASKVPIGTGTGTVSGRIIAVRLSPEGARVALVIAGTDGTAQIWIGTVVRTANTVQVSAAIPISPVGAVVADVAWSDQGKLYAVGAGRHGSDPSVYTVQCDGSFWTSDGIGYLPHAPDSITVAQNTYPSEPAVSAENRVWVQAGGSWTSPDQGITFGTNPIYVN